MSKRDRRNKKRDSRRMQIETATAAYTPQIRREKNKQNK